MTNSQIAQATQVPTSGASQAEDFQPQTRNPQQAPVILQPNGGLQQVGDRLLLTDDPGVRIIVPIGRGGARTKAAVTTQKSGDAGWLVLFVVVAAVVAVAGLWWKRKTSSGRTVKT